MPGLLIEKSATMAPVIEKKEKRSKSSKKERDDKVKKDRKKSSKSKKSEKKNKKSSKEAKEKKRKRKAEKQGVAAATSDSDASESNSSVASDAAANSEAKRRRVEENTNTTATTSNVTTITVNADKLATQTVAEFLEEHKVRLTGLSPGEEANQVVTRNFKLFPGKIQRLLESQGFTAPTPIQSTAWPIAIDKRDLIAVAKTGSGKTLGFGLPAMLHLKGLRQFCKRGDGIVAILLVLV